MVWVRMRFFSGVHQIVMSPKKLFNETPVEITLELIF